MQLQGKVILVAGAHGALGQATALGAAKAGATVVLLGRRVPKLNRVYDAIVKAEGPTPALYPLDMEGAGPADYEALAETIGRELGRLDGIVLCQAEFKGLVAFGSIPPEDLLRAMHVNATAPALLTQACLSLLSAADSASVVCLLDDPARVEKAYWGGYAMANAARRAWVRVLGDELESTAVRVIGLCPGPMRTPLRARAYFAEDPAQWPPASDYVPAILAAVAGAAPFVSGALHDLRI
nr:SDR family NAD(P)-dependent oxidoreductase [Pseudomarimonas arenosa]